MHLDFNGREYSVDLMGETTIRSRQTGFIIERIQVSVTAQDTEEHRLLDGVAKHAKRDGLNSTDGRGTVMNRWRILNATWKRISDTAGYDLILDLEEMK